MAPYDPGAIGRTYDAVAEEYAAAFGDDLSRLPLDRLVLDELANLAPQIGPVLDLGCGPGQVGAYLHAAGHDVIGIDLSPATLALAHHLEPALAFVVADLGRLPLQERSSAAAAAFYSLQYLPRSGLGDALAGIGRVLVPGGVLAVATHLGEGELWGPSDWMGHRVEPLAVTLYTARELQEAIVGSGFVIDAVRERDPLAHEHQGRRVYVTAHAV